MTLSWQACLILRDTEDCHVTDIMDLDCFYFHSIKLQTLSLSYRLYILQWTGFLGSEAGFNQTTDGPVNKYCIVKCHISNLWNAYLRFFFYLAIQTFMCKVQNHNDIWSLVNVHTAQFHKDKLRTILIYLTAHVFLTTLGLFLLLVTNIW